MPKMRAVQVSKAGGPFELVEREVPEPAANQIGGSLRHLPQRRLGQVRRLPGAEASRIPGHEIAGRVDKVGAAVTQWKKGDRVGVGWHGAHCFVRSRPSRC